MNPPRHIKFEDREMIVTDVLRVCIAFVVISGLCCLSGCNSQDERPTWALYPFEKAHDSNPILKAGDNEFLCPVRGSLVKWDEKDVFNPAAVVRDGKVQLLFRAEDIIGKHAGTSRIGLATSEDGVNFKKAPEPVLYPEKDDMNVYEWEGGIEDPRIVKSESGQYILTYTAYDGSLARLCVASSDDLIHWTKHGLVLNDKYKDTWSKSGAIVAKLEDDEVIAQKINGTYIMYWGDTDLFMATSDDLIHWQPLEENGTLVSVLKPRPGFFDSRLVESGPYALLRKEGILLIYNGMNLETGGDPTLPAGAYCAGQALFDKSNPSHLIDRLDTNFLRPDQPYETSGQVNQVCFVEGMVHFKNKWFLYYGTADSKIAVAVSGAPE
jgi:predicted GH43/DUF377 family glycosyl hydrolase